MPCTDPALAEIVPSLPRWLTAFPSGIRLFEVELLNADNGIAIAVEASRVPSDSELQAILASMDFVDAQLWWKSSSQSGFVRLDGGEEPLVLSLPGNIQQHVVPGQFIQVNADINRQMIDQVLSLARNEKIDQGDGERERLAVDLFCGSGNFSLPLAKNFDRVIGIEGLEDLVRSAEENARRNNLTNIEFMVSDLSDSRAMGKLKQKIDTLLLDPPRNGAAGVMPWILKRRPARIVYVSCHPSTMIRDAKPCLKGLQINRGGGDGYVSPHRPCRGGGAVRKIAIFSLYGCQQNALSVKMRDFFGVELIPLFSKRNTTFWECSNHV